MNMQDKSHYHEAYARSMRDPQGFWADAARTIDWISQNQHSYRTGEYVT